MNRAWANGEAIFHNGSNGQWLTTVWIAPNRHWAMMVVTNGGGTPANEATTQVVNAMISQFLP